MKIQKFKILTLGLLLPFLTGCSLLDNIVGSIALNYIFGSEYLLNRVSIASGEGESVPFEELPTTEAKRADLTYGLDALVVPKEIAVEMYSFNIEMEFAVTYSVGGADLFFVTEQSTELQEDEKMNFSASILYPTGTQENPTSVDDLDEWLTVERIINLKKEDAQDVTITITGTAGTKTKKQSFYFNLNGDGITLPGGEDVDIDLDYAIGVTEVDTDTTLEVTLDRTKLKDGIEIPLQVMWIDFARTDETGDLTISMSALGVDYTVELPEVTLPVDVIVNETLIEYPVTVTLKQSAAVPAADVVVTFTARVTK